MCPVRSVTHVPGCTGRWSARVAREATLSFGSITVGGRFAELVEAPPRVPVPANGRIELRVRWLPELVLHVRDERTEEELSEVTLVRAPYTPSAVHEHPGAFDAQRLLFRDAPSPLRLQPRVLSGSSVHVGAPDHAWTRVELESDAGGERAIDLPRGASLDVGIAGGPLDPECVLRVGEPLAEPRCELEVGGRDRIALEGLPLGRQRVRLEIGDWRGDPLVLSEGEVELREGRRGFLQLDASGAPSPDSVPFAGIVVVPAEWGLDRFELVLHLLDTPLAGREAIERLPSSRLERSEFDPRAWRWRHPNAQAGRYEVELEELHCSLVVDVGPKGREDVRLEVPSPAELRVRVLDAFDGSELEDARLFWTCARPDGVRGVGYGRAAREGAGGAFLVRAPRTAIELRTLVDGYASADDELDLRDAPAERSLRLARTPRIALELVDAGAAVPWPRGAEVAWRSADRPGVQGRATSRGGARIVLEVPAPGDYVLELPPIEGYAPLHEARVTVGADGRAELALGLARR